MINIVDRNLRYSCKKCGRFIKNFIENEVKMIKLIYLENKIIAQVQHRPDNKCVV